MTASQNRSQIGSGTPQRYTGGLQFSESKWNDLGKGLRSSVPIHLYSARTGGSIRKAPDTSQLRVFSTLTMFQLPVSSTPTPTLQVSITDRTLHSNQSSIRQGDTPSSRALTAIQTWLASIRFYFGLTSPASPIRRTLCVSCSPCALEQRSQGDRPTSAHPIPSAKSPLFRWNGMK